MQQQRQQRKKIIFFEYKAKNLKLKILLSQISSIRSIYFTGGKSNSTSALLVNQGGNSVIGSNVQGGTSNPSMVSLHHAVPIEIRSSSSTSSASSSVKSGNSNKNGKILINTRSNISLSNSISTGQQNLPKNVPSYFVTDPNDEGKFLIIDNISKVSLLSSSI